MFNISTAKNSAWRAIYIYWNNQQVAHLGVDPSMGYGSPRLFGGVQHYHFNINLPYMKWRADSGRVRKYVYQKQSKFWFNLDGRR